MVSSYTDTHTITEVTENLPQTDKLKSYFSKVTLHYREKKSVRIQSYEDLI